MEKEEEEKEKEDAWVLNGEHASREKLLTMVIFSILVHKNVY